MTATIRTAILRANAVFLLVAAAGGFATDLIGVFLRPRRVRARGRQCAVCRHRLR